MKSILHLPVSSAPRTSRTGSRSGGRRLAGPLLLLVACWLASALPAAAQQYSINWYKIAGGGGTSTGATYSVSGTIGQPDASGPMTGGNYSLTGGFWSLIAAVSTPGAPPLLISRQGRTVTVYWQDVTGWTLQQNHAVNSPGTWSVNSSYTNSNGTNYLTLTAPAGNLFFRLTGP